MSDPAVSFAANTVVPLFQPVVSLRSGRIVGVEALARLKTDGPTLITPNLFLPGLDDEALLSLFCTMLKKAVDAYVARGLCDDNIYLSINVNAQIALRPDFHDLVQFILADKAFDPHNLVLEILEGESIGDIESMIEALHRMKATGIRFALDDIGSAYASLMNIKDLPVDILKLDQAFARKLEERPHDLQFVMSLLGLARGLEKILVVEGAETASIVDALTILGVDNVQGYALSRPLPEAEIKAFIRDWAPVAATKTPRSLLGSFASHLTAVETCRMLANQPLPILWQEETKNPHTCQIGRYFDRAGLHETDYGCAHKRFHTVMAEYETEPVAWQAAANAFRTLLFEAILKARDHDEDDTMRPVACKAAS